MFSIPFIATSSCGKKKDIAQKKALNLSFYSPIRTLNPTIGGEMPGCYAIIMLFEGLTRADAQGNSSLAVAEKYTVSA